MCSYWRHTYYASESIPIGFRSVFFPINSFSKKKRVMQHETKNMYGLKGSHYEAHMIKINEYLVIFSWAKEKL